MQNNALTSPKPQTYIEKDPIGPLKRLWAPRSVVACRLSLSSKNNANTSPKSQTYIEKAPRES